MTHAVATHTRNSQLLENSTPSNGILMYHITFQIKLEINNYIQFNSKLVNMPHSTDLFST